MAGWRAPRECRPTPLGQVLVHHPAGNRSPISHWQTLRTRPSPHLCRGDRGRSGLVGWGRTLLRGHLIGGGHTGSCTRRCGRTSHRLGSSAAELLPLGRVPPNGPAPQAGPNRHDRHRCPSAPVQQRRAKDQHVPLLYQYLPMFNGCKHQGGSVTAVVVVRRRDGRALCWLARCSLRRLSLPSSCLRFVPLQAAQGL